MAGTARTEYAKCEDGYVAYQVVGDGPLDLAFVSTWGSNIDPWWEEPGHERFLRRLASFARPICSDERGTGRAVGPGPRCRGAAPAA